MKRKNLSMSLFFTKKLRRPLFYLLYAFLIMDSGWGEEIELESDSKANMPFYLAQAKKVPKSKLNQKSQRKVESQDDSVSTEAEDESFEPESESPVKGKKGQKKPLKPSEDGESLIKEGYVSANLDDDYAGRYAPSLGRISKKDVTLYLTSSSSSYSTDYSEELNLKQKLSSSVVTSSFALDMGSLAAGFFLFRTQSKNEISMTGTKGSENTSESMGAGLGLGFSPSESIDLETSFIYAPLTSKSLDKDTEVTTTTKSTISSVILSLGAHSSKYEVFLSYKPESKMKQKSSNSDGGTPIDSDSTMPSVIDLGGRYLVARLLFVGASFETENSNNEEEKMSNTLLGLEAGMPFNSFQLGLNLTQGARTSSSKDSDYESKMKPTSVAFSGLFKVSKAGQVGLGLKSVQEPHTFGDAKGKSSELAFDLAGSLIF